MKHNFLLDKIQKKNCLLCYTDYWLTTNAVTTTKVTAWLPARSKWRWAPADHLRHSR